MGTQDNADNDDFDLSSLSPEEREAMGLTETDDQSALDAVLKGAGKASAAAVVNDDTDDDDDTPAANKGTDVDEDAAAAAAAAEEAAAAAAAATAAPTDSGKASPAEKVVDKGSTDEFLPVYKAAAPENFAERMQALNAEKATAFKKFTDGEMSAEDYAAAEQKYLDDRDALVSAKNRAEMAADMEQQTTAQRWMWEVNNFKRTALSTDGVDYDKNPALNAKWDSFVKVLAQDPENADKPGEWFLTEAHKMVKAMEGIGMPQAPGGKESGKPAPTNAGKAPDLSVIPPSLGKLPAAESGDSGKNEFGHMENLEGLEWERAFAKMTPDQQERYLANH